MKKLFLALAVLAACSQPKKNDDQIQRETVESPMTEVKQGHYVALQATEVMSIDGEANESIWEKADWMKIDQVWLGNQPDSLDFSGRFKACWDKNNVYLLVEIVDDTLIDIHEDPLDNYWDDDCVEVFVDEDDSDGEHLSSYNAFAYHIGLDYTVVDYGVDTMPHIYDHAQAKRIMKEGKYYWEIAMQVYTSDYDDGKKNSPVELTLGKQMGFMIAYCDNDYSQQRENFIGNVFVEGEDKNQGYKDAGVFGTISLK